MKSRITIASLVMLMVCAGCGDSHEKVAADKVSTGNEMLAILQSIKDESSAAAAKDKFKALEAKVKAIQEREAKLGVPSDAELKKVGEKYQKEHAELQAKMMSEFMRIASIPGIDKSLDELDKSMSNMK